MAEDRPEDPGPGARRLPFEPGRLPGWPALLPATIAVAMLAACLRLAGLAQEHWPGAEAALELAQPFAAIEAEQALELGRLLEPGAGPEVAARLEAGIGQEPAKARRLSPADSRAAAAQAAEIARELAQRRQQVEAREQAMELREAAIAVAQGNLGQQIDQLERLRKELQALVDQLKASDDASLAQLVKLYEGMKAKNAAVVLEQLDIRILLPLARRMRDAKLAAIVALMDPVKAKQLTLAMAQPTPLPSLP